MTVGEQTRRTVEAGQYLAPSGRLVSIGDAVTRAVSEYRHHRAQSNIEPFARRFAAT